MLLMGLPGKYFPTVVCFWDWLSPDKIVHLILFAVLPCVTLWGYRKHLFNQNYQHKKKLIITITLISILYGGLTELMQKYVFINRYCSVFDFLADTLGCIIGTFFFTFIMQKKLKKIKKSDVNI